MQVGYPYGFDGRGRTAEASEESHIRDLIEQLLFTTPGERVNRPEFGSGLLQLVFEPNSSALAAAAQFTVQAALQQWLGELIQIETATVESDDSTMRVTVRYTIRSTEQQHTDEFTRRKEQP